jgi:serine/threonine protein kinase/tetratricopeptide (TPR) repeat protein
MTAEEWVVIKGIVSDALAVPEARRAAVIDSGCAGDESLRAQVRSLLESVALAADLYEAPAFSTSGLLVALAEAGDPAKTLAGERIGAYRVVEEIGRGGMGAAYLAVRDDNTYEKRVAIKLIKRGMDTDAILRRFHHERRILASLEHPNIVTLLDGGSTADGLPYFVMEYVDGVPLDAYCDAHALPIPERLRLFQAVCAAVHHAHAQRVLHRDLKPSNILVTSSGVPKLLDFGIAKVLDASQDGHTVDPTLAGRVMTPQYASPEQLRGQTLTAASDVYSLGVLLYLLLAGRLPYRVRGLSSDSDRVVCEARRAAPSTVVDEAAGVARGRTAAQLRADLAGTLDTIVLTALDTDPARRYRTARELSDDIQRYLDRQPIAARKASRHSFAAMAAMFTLIVLGFVGLVARRPVVTAADPRSIAVLPLSHPADGEDVEYLADGIAEGVSSRLSTVSGLKVIGRESARRYRGSSTDPQQIARELGVDIIVTGEIARRGDRLTISAGLIDARDRRRLWGQRYERPTGDVQAIQRELTQQIVDSLRLRVTPEQRAVVNKRHVPEAGAYELYLRGRFFSNKRTPEGLARSVTLFSDAIARDPEFALAYAGLADANGLLTEYHARPAEQTYPESLRAATKALVLDDTLAEAHASLAYLRHFYEWDAAGAEEAFRRALALNPNFATAHQWYAEFLSAAGRHDEALAEIRIATSLDPVSLIANSVEAFLLYMAGRHDESIAKSLQVIDMDPNFPEVWEYLKRAYDQKGMFREAIAARQTRRRILGSDTRETPALRGAAAATSRAEYWKYRLEQELVEARTEGLLPFEFAEILAQAGDTRQALDWLERACAGHDFMTVYVRVLPNLTPLHREARYLDVVRRGCAVSPQGRRNEKPR